MASDWLPAWKATVLLHTSGLALLQAASCVVKQGAWLCPPFAQEQCASWNLGSALDGPQSTAGAVLSLQLEQCASWNLGSALDGPQFTVYGWAQEG